MRRVACCRWSFLVPALAWGCAGAAWDGHSFKNGAVAFHVGPAPASWRSIEPGDALIAYRDDAAGATIALNGRCGEDGDDVPLRALTHHLFLYFEHRSAEAERTLTLAGREALRTSLDADLDGVTKHFVVVVLKKDGCVYDFMLIAAPASAERAEPEFDRFVAGFGTD